MHFSVSDLDWGERGDENERRQMLRNGYLQVCFGEEKLNLHNWPVVVIRIDKFAMQIGI